MRGQPKMGVSYVLSAVRRFLSGILEEQHEYRVMVRYHDKAHYPVDPAHHFTSQ